jgi:iron complex transport system ATP-binding protein
MTQQTYLQTFFYTIMISVKNISFSYGVENVIENVNLEINSREYIGIIGPNGSGKSTLIKCICGLLKPQNGSININGTDSSHLDRPSFAKKIAYVPQSVDLAFNLSVKEIVKMGRFPYAQNLLSSDENAREVLENVLAQLELNHLKDRNFSDLSGGEKQRTIIASALAQEADILILDEPTSALDLKHQQEIYQILDFLCHEKGKTVIVVTHDINLSAQYCKRLILLDKGNKIADGSPKDVLKFQTIQNVYGVKVYIDINPFTKSLYIVPYSKIDKE